MKKKIQSSLRDGICYSLYVEYPQNSIVKGLVYKFTLWSGNKLKRFSGRSFSHWVFNPRGVNNTRLAEPTCQSCFFFFFKWLLAQVVSQVDLTICTARCIIAAFTQCLNKVFSIINRVFLIQNVISSFEVNWFSCFIIVIKSFLQNFASQIYTKNNTFSIEFLRKTKF